MKPGYRAYEDKDAAAVSELMKQLGYAHTAESICFNVEALRSQGSEVFVAEDAGEVCGCVAALIDVRLAAGIKGEIVSLVVSEKTRGLGVGNGLVACAEDWLSAHVKEIRVRANSLRTEAHHFYKQRGYSISKEQLIFLKKL